MYRVRAAKVVTVKELFSWKRIDIAAKSIARVQFQHPGSYILPAIPELYRKVKLKGKWSKRRAFTFGIKHEFNHSFDDKNWPELKIQFVPRSRLSISVVKSVS